MKLQEEIIITIKVVRPREAAPQEILSLDFIRIRT